MIQVYRMFFISWKWCASLQYYWSAADSRRRSGSLVYNIFVSPHRTATHTGPDKKVLRCDNSSRCFVRVFTLAKTNTGNTMGADQLWLLECCGTRSAITQGWNHYRAVTLGRSSVSILATFDTPMLKIAFCWNNKCEFTLTHLTWISVQGLLLLNNIYLFWEGRHNISSLQLAVMSMNSLFTSECKRNSWINPNFYVDCLLGALLFLRSSLLAGLLF